MRIFFLIKSAELQFCTYSKVLSRSGWRCLVRLVCVQSSFQSWYTFLVSALGVFYLIGFPIVPASTPASLPIHLHCLFPIISLNHSHLLILSIEVESISHSGLAIKGAKEVSLPCISHFLLWSFPQLNITWLIQLHWSFSDAECNHPCSASLVWQGSKAEFLSAELRSFLQSVNSIYRGSHHSFIFSGSSFITQR